ncbi:MAG TPA: glycoside hydrolase family 52 protein [Opitutus sp.]|nr:glycoside hydrolase family 52 protein [Opitutus sp.]
MGTRTAHAPLGAHASFDFGPPGEPAGFALPADTAPAQDVFVGCRPDPGAPWSLLPFFQPVPRGPAPLPKGRFGRFLAWAGDKWMIGPLVFKLCTPFLLERDEDERFRYAPVVCGYLEYDNTHCADAAELIFGLGAAGEPVSDPALAGFQLADTHGFATAADSEVSLRGGSQVFGVELGPAAVVHFTVPPHAKRIYPLVLGFFQPGFHHTRDFAGLGAVLAHGVAAHPRYVAASDARDAAFMRSPATPDVKARVALETRAWLAATRRLAGEAEIDPTPLHDLARALGHA